MRNINQVTLLGNITRSPEVRYTPNGNAVISFSIATNRDWTDKTSGEKKTAVDYHNIVFWGKVAELIAQYSEKGSRILVQGRLQTRSWDKDGVKRYTTEIIGNDFVLFDKKSGVAKPIEEAPPVEEPRGASSENVNADAADLGMKENINYSVAFKRLFGREPTGGEEDISPGKVGEQTELINPEDIPF